MKYWEIIADTSSKPVGIGAASQRLIPAGERSSSPMRTATTESVSLSVRMKYWGRFWNLNRRFAPGRTPRGLRSAWNKARQTIADQVKTSSVTSSDVSTYLRHGWISRRGWTFAETPFSAISQIQLEPGVSRSEAAVQSALW